MNKAVVSFFLSFFILFCSFLVLGATVPAYAAASTITTNATGDGTGDVSSTEGFLNLTYPLGVTPQTSSPIVNGSSVDVVASTGLDSLASWNDCESSGGISSGNGTTTATCSFSSLDANKNITATFSYNMSTITVNATGDGHGDVSYTDGFIILYYPFDVTPQTSDPIVNGNSVDVIATAGFDSLVYWNDCESSGGTLTGNGTRTATCSFSSLDENKNITASFTYNMSIITVNATGDGYGDVSYTEGFTILYYPFDITPKTSSPIVNGNSVDVIAAAGFDSLAYWNDCESSGGTLTGNGTRTATCSFSSLDADKNITASFTYNMSTITVNATGDGYGDVSYTEGFTILYYPFDVTPQNSSPIVNGNSVDVIAAAGFDSLVFWNDCEASGGTSTGNGTRTAICTFSSLDADKNITATFTYNMSSITVNGSGTGNGSFSSSEGIINLMYPMDGNSVTSNSILNGNSVNVVASANFDSLVSWNDCESSGGASTGNGTRTATCSFSSLDANKNITATFNYNMSTITVNAAGDGKGSISSSEGLVNVNYPVGLTPRTSNPILNGSTVDVVATADFDSLVTWNDCESSGGTLTGNGTRTATCSFSSLDADKNITATFTYNMSFITVNGSGTGNGSFSSSEGIINLMYPMHGNSVTSNSILNGNSVNVVASANFDSLVTWNDCESSGGTSSGTGTNTATCSFSSLDADKNITATFISNTSTITVNATGEGNGFVRVSQGLIGFLYPTGGSTRTSIPIPNGSSIDVIAETGSGSLASWNDCETSGGISSGNGSSIATCTFSSLDTDKVVNVTYTLGAYNLSIIKAGNGTGTVTSTPVDIDCGINCSGQYDYNTEIMLTATPEEDSKFVAWTGDADCEDGIVTMTNDINCMANFSRFPWPIFMHILNGSVK